MLEDNTQLPPTEDTQPIQTIRQPTYWLWRLAPPLLLIGMIIALALVLSGTDEDDTPNQITLSIAGESTRITTDATTVADVFAEQDITIGAGDQVLPGLLASVQDDMVIRVERARTVTIILDDTTSVIRTILDNPANILQNAGIAVDNADRILLDGTTATVDDLTTWPIPVTTITIERAINVTIRDGDQIIPLRTTRETVGDALVQAGVSLFLADTVIPDVSAEIVPDMEIVVDRSRELTVVADGTRTEIRTTSTTIGEALAEAGVTLTGLDYAVPDEGSPVIDGISVRVIRVVEEIITEEEVIPFETTLQADSALTLDSRRVQQAGQNGLQQRTYRLRYENGIEVSRDLETDEMVRVPQNEVIAYGTNIVLRTINTPEGPREYWRHLRVYTTSYHPAALGGDNITATGAILEHGVIGADPRIIPYYTGVYVPEYGFGEILDTGGPRSSPYWIDLGYTDADFVGWSRMWDIYLLTPVPENINYLLPPASRGGPVVP